MDHHKQTTLFSVINAGNALEEQLSAELTKVGLSMAKYGALCVLAASEDPLPLSVCARRMTCVKSNITQLMDRLAQDGLIERVPDPNDRRSVKAKLTEKGAELQHIGDQLCAELEREIEEKLAGHDFTALRNTMHLLQN